MLPTVPPHLLGSEHVRHVSRAAVLREAEVEADTAAAERAPRLWQHRGLPARRCFKYHRGGKVVVEGALRLFSRSLYNQQSSPPSSLASPRTIDLPLRRRESLTDDVLERAWLWTSVNQASPSSQPQQLPTSSPRNSWVRTHWVKYHHGLVDLTMWQSNPLPLIESTVATGRRDSWQNCLSTPV